MTDDRFKALEASGVDAFTRREIADLFARQASAEAAASEHRRLAADANRVADDLQKKLDKQLASNADAVRELAKQRDLLRGEKANLAELQAKAAAGEARNADLRATIAGMKSRPPSVSPSPISTGAIL